MLSPSAIDSCGIACCYFCRFFFIYLRGDWFHKHLWLDAFNAHHHYIFLDLHLFVWCVCVRSELNEFACASFRKFNFKQDNNIRNWNIPTHLPCAVISTSKSFCFFYLLLYYLPLICIPFRRAIWRNWLSLNGIMCELKQQSNQSKWRRICTKHVSEVKCAACTIHYSTFVFCSTFSIHMHTHDHLPPKSKPQ